MSVRINENFNSSTDYAERLKEEQRAREAEKSKETGGGAKALGNVSEQCDEYISSEKSKAKTVGLYRVEQDNNGGQKILFDSPGKAVKGDASGQKQPAVKGDASGQKQPAVKGDNSEKSPEKCIADTDKVEREIRELKEKKQQLEQQIRQISDDESKTRELEKKLAEVENELNQKDNDAYRRQNASVVRVD